MARGESYNEFIKKFEFKRTTDECYTPSYIYDCVADYVVNRYGINEDKFIRPFYPNGDYKKECYNEKVVVDNPPFSIFSEIIKYFCENDIKFFLFAPLLTLFTATVINSKTCAIIPDFTCVYENGARIKTAFITNLDLTHKIETAVKFSQKLNEVQKQNIKNKKITSYEKPCYIMNASDFSVLCNKNVDFYLDEKDFYSASNLDALKKINKKLFGKSLVISEHAEKRLSQAKENAIKEKYTKKYDYIIELSEDEKIKRSKLK